MFHNITDKPPFSQWLKLHPLIANILIALGYWGLSQIGHAVAEVHHQVSPIWPPTGLVFAAIFIGQWRVLPGIITGIILVHAFNGYGWVGALTISLGNISEALVALFLLSVVRRFKAHLGDYLLPAWLIASSLLAPLAAASTGAFTICYICKFVPAETIGQLWLTSWAGDAIGGLIIAPVLLTLRPFKLSVDWSLKCLLLVAVALATYTIMFSYGVDAPLLFLAFPLLLIACRWFGPSGAAWTTLGFITYATFSVFMRLAPLESHDQHLDILQLDAFLAALAITSLTISAFYRKGHFLLPAIILLLGWTLSGWLYYTLRTNIKKLDEFSFQSLVQDSEAAIENRFRAYTEALRASAIYYINSEEVTRVEWRAYVNYLEIQTRYPGIKGIGYIMPFSAEAIPEYVDTVRREELPDFSIKQVPGAERPPVDEMGSAHYIITHIEPIENNRQALGLNVASESNRQAAARRARDTGEPTISGRITLVQDGKQRGSSLLYVPMYQLAAPTDTLAQRRAAFIGWTYAPFVSENFLQGVLGSRVGQIDFDSYDDATIQPKTLVYSTKEKPPHEAQHTFDLVSQLDLGGRTFSFGWQRGADFSEQHSFAATIAATCLALGTCLLAGIFVSLQVMNRRANHLVKQKTIELRKTNDSLQIEVYAKNKMESEATVARKAAESANFAKSEFLATMSHEIRTPMNSVIGFAELLFSSKLSADQRLWASYIQASGGDLLQIINDILDFSKIEAGKLELENIHFSLSDTLEEVVGSFSAITAKKGLCIDIIEAKNLPPLLEGDPIRLKQIINNLIGNSLKFTAKGSICVSIAWTGTPQKGTASIRIADTGIGIPAHKMGELFQEFSQVDSTTTRQFEGTGLGLAICKKLTGLMHGTIRAQSTLGEGTTMTLEIPFSVSQQTADLPVKTTRPLTVENKYEFRQSGTDILLVDDNLINQQLGLVILQRLGCQVTLASNGAEAIEAVKLKHYPIIFMDCQMPEMNGYDATKAIRKLEKTGALPGHRAGTNIVIIALTANALAKCSDACIEAGMDDYISKPCHIADFQNALDSQLATNGEEATSALKHSKKRI